MTLDECWKWQWHALGNIKNENWIWDGNKQDKHNFWVKTEGMNDLYSSLDWWEMFYDNSAVK